MDLNRVYLIGNLTRDPDPPRYTASRKAVTRLRLAVNRQFRTESGEQREETAYVDIDVWGRQAETCAQYLRKGSPVLVEGRLQYDEWEKDGQKHNRLRVVASRVQFLSAGPKGGGESRAPRETADAREPTAPAAEPPIAEEEAPAAEPVGAGGTSGSGDDDNLPF